MPLVSVSYLPNLQGADWKLAIVLKEIVPAGLYSKQGQLTPGSIELFLNPTGLGDHLTVDVLVNIEAYYYDDRANVEERSEAIKDALHKFWPYNTFAVWLKLVNAGWASDSNDPEFDGDMSMEAAIDRVKDSIQKVVDALTK